MAATMIAFQPGSNLDFAFFSGKPYEDSAPYTFTPPLPAPQPPKQSGPSPQPLFTFLEVAEIIGAYEYFRRACEMDPFNTDKREAFDQATKKVDAVWQHYNAGCLPGNACILLRLFLNLWFWDADLSVLPHHASASNSTL